MNTTVTTPLTRGGRTVGASRTTLEWAVYRVDVNGAPVGVPDIFPSREMARTERRVLATSNPTSEYKVFRRLVQESVVR